MTAPAQIPLLRPRIIAHTGRTPPGMCTEAAAKATPIQQPRKIGSSHERRDPKEARAEGGQDRQNGCGRDRPARREGQGEPERREQQRRRKRAAPHRSAR